MDKRNKKRKQKVILFLISIIVLISTFFIYGAIKSKNKKDSEDIIIAKAEENIKTKDETEKIYEEQNRIEKMKEYIESNVDISNYGIYYYDIETGESLKINEKMKFEAASTIKVPIAMMIADKINSKELNEEYEVVYNQSDYTEGAGNMQGSIEVGDKVTVKELLKNMISYSDNIATNMLKRIAGNKAEYILNITGIEMEEESNVVTTEQEFLVLKKLYNESKNNVQYSNIIELMKSTDTHDRIDKYIPKEIVAHKIGDYKEYINDVAIVYADKPYILCIFSKNEWENGRENIAKISKRIYEIKSDKL